MHVESLDGYSASGSRADLYLLADVSGSMSGIMANIKANMQTTISQAVAQIPDLQVGIGSLVGMRLRKVSPAAIVRPLITATKAGLDLDIDALGSGSQEISVLVVEANQGG